MPTDRQYAAQIDHWRERALFAERDRDEAWRQHNMAEIGRLNAEARLARAIATLEYMGGAEIVVDELRNGALPEPSDSLRLSNEGSREDEAWEKRSRER